MLKRESYLSRIRGFYNSDLIKILVGIRRCGKSVILRQIIDELKENGCDDEHIIFINFEYIEYEELRDYKKLNIFIKNRLTDKKRYYIFLDEIQKVEKFEEVINSLRASTDYYQKNYPRFYQEDMFYLIFILYHIKNLFF